MNNLAEPPTGPFGNTLRVAQGEDFATHLDLTRNDCVVTLKRNLRAGYYDLITLGKCEVLRCQIGGWPYVDIKRASLALEIEMNTRPTAPSGNRSNFLDRSSDSCLSGWIVEAAASPASHSLGMRNRHGTCDHSHNYEQDFEIAS
jgi:hypothetical protein